MKKILIATFDMEVGGVERSLIGMLEHFDYDRYEVDLLLYRHQGEFMELIPKQVRLLPEIPIYATFRKSIKENLAEKQYGIGFSRVLSKLQANVSGRWKGMKEPGYYQMQLMWKYALPLLPRVDGVYDVAISYLWPHELVASKVTAKRKLAWIHTDYSAVETDIEEDLKTWSAFDYTIAVSEACRASFLTKYGVLQPHVRVIENIASPDFITWMAEEPLTDVPPAEGKFKLLTVARLSHAKGIDNAIYAMKLLRDRGLHDMVWYVVGYGGDEPMLRRLIKEHGLEDAFILLGKKENPYPYIKDCDLYVQPSRYEGKAVTVTEAMILRKPILITNYPTASSQVEHGVDGVICDNSIEGLAVGIEEMYRRSELRDRLTANLQRKEFSNGSELVKLYKLMA